MEKDKKIIHILSISVFALLLFALFIPLNSKIVATIILLSAVVICPIYIKKRKILSIYKDQVLLIILMSGLIYLMLYYLLGIKFGFSKNPYYLNEISITQYIVPYIFIIVTIEIIRHIFLCQDIKFVNILCLISSILVDLLMFSSIVNITSFNKFMDLVGLHLFPALTSNILYHKLSKQYGVIPNIVYRLITIITPYFLNFSPLTPDSLIAVFKLIIPLLILGFVSVLYDKKDKRATKKTSKLTYAGYGVFGVAMISIVMLISCQFRFGLIVIASNSMVGEFSKGDAVIYEQYDNQLILEGDIIVFEKNDMKVIHRVVKIEYIDNQMRYYTKGDANEHIDIGFISEDSILGIVDFKISYIGYPTLWIRDAFSR